MKRYFLELAYHGKNYHGWQRQPNAVSIQQTLEERMSLLLREEISLTTAGRTDAGVHALQTFVHFDVQNPPVNPDDFVHRLNAFLPPDIAVKAMFSVPDNAHARYDARLRSYIYQITTKKNPFLTDFAWRYENRLDLDAMNQAAAVLPEYEDFTSFSKVKTDVKHFLCDVREAYWEKKGDLLIFHISANRFLRNMVRSIVGTLVEVGQGKRKPEDMHEIIQGKNRNLAGPSAPAKGLFLEKVIYKPEIAEFLK